MHVMLIEDDPLVRDLVMDILLDEGMSVEGLASAEDALVLLGAGQVPDVLVVDVNLGSGLSGADLASIARERHPEVQVVIISGSPAAAIANRAPMARRERFVAKPFAPEVLAQAIRDAAAEAVEDGRP